MKIFLTLKQRNRLIKNIKILKKELDIKISLNGTLLEFTGDSLKEYDSGIVLDAVAQGFSVKNALLLKNPDYIIEKVELKNYLRPQRLRQIKARIIGKEGKAIKTLKQLSDCDIKIDDYSVCILGLFEDVKLAKQAVLRLIRGSKHSYVYDKLEHKQLFDEDDLGLKIEKRQF